MSRKFRRMPRLQRRLLLRQLRQSGVASSHFRCLSLHVKHPVRTRLDFVAAGRSPTIASASDFVLVLLEILVYKAVSVSGRGISGSQKCQSPSVVIGKGGVFIKE